MIEYLKGNPDKIICATQGNGTTSHLTSELFQLMAKVKLRHIPYRGSAPALQGLLAGDVDLMFDNLGVSLALVDSGKLKLLAVASADVCRRSRMYRLWPRRCPVLKRSPGTASSRPRDPENIVDKINADVNEALRQPEVQDHLRKLSAEISGVRSTRLPTTCGKKSTGGPP